MIADTTAELGDFLRTPRGALAGFSALLPVVNLELQVVPIEPFYAGGGFVAVPPVAAALLASGACLAVVAGTLRQRSEVATLPAVDIPRTLRLRAALPLLVAAGCLVFYLAQHAAVGLGFYPNMMRWGPGHPGRLVGDAVLTLAYVGAFGGLSRALALLALIGYVSPRD